MNELTPFHYLDFTVRIFTIDGDPWFIAADVCAVLDITSARDAVSSLDDDEKQQVSRDVANNYGGTNQLNPGETLWLISEPGLYSLVLRSRKPEAKAFKRWITHEVLPQLRKTGVAQGRELSRYELLKLALEAEEERLRAEQQLEIKEERVQELTSHLAVIGPDAGAWQTLAATGDDWFVEDVGRILNRDSAIETGPRRLWDSLYGWDVMTRYRERPQPRSKFIDRGYFRVRIVSYPDPGGGPTPKSAPQVRITFKGISWIHKKLGGADPVEGLVYPSLSPLPLPAGSDSSYDGRLSGEEETY